MKVLYERENLRITLLNEDYYMVETPCHTLRGYYKRLGENKSVARIDYWKDGKTGRLKSSKNKLYNHTLRWFDYILEEYLGKEAV